MRFESAIEAQRHKEVLADNDSLHSQPILKLDRDLEKHGRDIYTRENFYIFQNELWIACVDCGVKSKKEKDGVETLDIVDNSGVNHKLREVVYIVVSSVSSDGCRLRPSVVMATPKFLIFFRLN
jgi:hypothetical protein